MVRHGVGLNHPRSARGRAAGDQDSAVGQQRGCVTHPRCVERTGGSELARRRVVDLGRGYGLGAVAAPGEENAPISKPGRGRHVESRDRGPGAGELAGPWVEDLRRRRVETHDQDAPVEKERGCAIVRSGHRAGGGEAARQARSDAGCLHRRGRGTFERGGTGAGDRSGRARRFAGTRPTRRRSADGVTADGQSRHDRNHGQQSEAGNRPAFAAASRRPRPRQASRVGSGRHQFRVDEPPQALIEFGIGRPVIHLGVPLAGGPGPSSAAS